MDDLETMVGISALAVIMKSLRPTLFVCVCRTGDCGFNALDMQTYMHINGLWLSVYGDLQSYYIRLGHNCLQN